MKKTVNILIFIILFSSFLVSKNLTLHDYDNPSASHILDVEIINDLLIVSGMIGGIEFYNISDPENLNHLDNLQLSSGGGGGGGPNQTKPNCIVASGNYAYVTTNQGLGVINISNPDNPEYLGIVSGTNGYILENLDVYGNFLAVAAHEDGVLFYDISNPDSPEYIETFQTTNAWAVRLEAFPEHPNYEFVIYIADSDFITVAAYMYYNNNHDFAYIDNIILESAVKDIAYDNNLVYFAKGTGGVDVYQTNGTHQIEDITLNCSMHVPCYLDTYDTSVLANRLSTFDNKLAVSDWDDVEILEWNGFNLEQVGFKNTTRRTMAIATKDNYIYSGEWASVQIFEYGEIDGSDLDLNTYELNFPYVENGNSYTMSVDVSNNGNQILEIFDAYTTNNEFSYTQLNDLDPGETQTIDIVYTADSNNSSGSYRIYSNDEDEYEIICETNGNINGANIGDVAPDFELDIIANGSGTFRLSEHSGQIVVLAFFAPN